MLSAAKHLVARPMREYYVYMMTNVSRTLYTGVTNDLVRRIAEHQQKAIPGFTSRYNINQLVWYEATSDVRSAITREKQIKGWKRRRKVALVTSANPNWTDLSEQWMQHGDEILRPPPAASG